MRVIAGDANDGHLECAGAETAVHVAAVAGSSAEHCAVPDGLIFVIKVGRNGNPAVVASGGIP